MGQPAARALIDIGAHTGLILTGSLNVYIGGGQAARKGDAVACSSHGDSSIVEGSSSVLINGMAAARKGDKTSCGTPPIPPPQGQTPAPDKIYHKTWNKNANEDGTAKTDYPDVLDITAVDAYAGLKDRTGNGSYDQAVAGFALMDFQAHGDWEPFGGKYGGIGASGGFSVAKADALAGAYGSNGVYGAEASANASYLSGNAEVHIGKEDGPLYASGGASGDVFYAEAYADAELYTGGSESRYGFYAGAGAEAGLAQGSLSGETTVGLLNIKTHVDGDIGAVGGTVGGGFYVDTDDYIVNVKVDLGFDIGLGVQGGFDISLNYKPLVDLWNWIFSSDSDSAPTPTVVEGTILTGCFSVLIG